MPLPYDRNSYVIMWHQMPYGACSSNHVLHRDSDASRGTFLQAGLRNETALPVQSCADL